MTMTMSTTMMTKLKLTVFCELKTQGRISTELARTNQLINKVHANKELISGLEIRLADVKSVKAMQRLPLTSKSPNVTSSMGKGKRIARQDGSPGSKTRLIAACSLVQKEQKSDMTGR